MPKGTDEEDLLVGLAKALTQHQIKQLQSGDISPAEIRNILTHLKQNNISYDMMDSGEADTTIRLLDDINIDDFREAQDATYTQYKKA